MLAGAGVERYHADLLQLCKTHYSASGESAAIPLGVQLAGTIPAMADMAEVQSAIGAIQHQELGYADFLQRIFAAGITDYFVYLAGRRAVYVDRTGESHIERFPS